jgi:hypothetical protein
MKRILLALLLAVLPIAGSAQIATPGGGGGGVVVATAGPVTLTGIVPETVMASLRIPANSIGRNGAVQVIALWAYTNSANNKTMIARFSSSAGVTGGIVASVTATTSATAQTSIILHANNATNVQNFYPPAWTAPYGTANSAFNNTGFDTTADTYFNITGTVPTASETLTLQHAYAVVTQAN